MLMRVKAAFVALALVPAAGPIAVGAEETPAAASEWVAAYAEARLVLQELKADVEALRRLRAAQKELVVSDGYRARLFADIFRPVAVFQLICWSSVSIGSPARSRMSMSFQSRLSSAGRSRTILVSLRARRLAA